jgi:hypothetical protein
VLNTTTKTYTMSMYGKTKYSLLNAITQEELIVVCDDNKIDVDKTKDAADIWLNDMRAGGRFKKENLIKILTNRKVDIPENATENDLAASVWNSRPDSHIEHDDPAGAVAQKMVELERKHEDELAAAKVELDQKNKDEIASTKKDLHDMQVEAKKKIDSASADAELKFKDQIASAESKMKIEMRLREDASKEMDAQKQKYADMMNKTSAETKAADHLRKQQDIFTKIIKGNRQLHQNLIQAGLYDGVEFKDSSEVQNGAGSSSSTSGMATKGGSNMNSGANIFGSAADIHKDGANFFGNTAHGLNGIFGAQTLGSTVQHPKKTFDDNRPRDPYSELPLNDPNYRPPHVEASSNRGNGDVDMNVIDDAFTMPQDSNTHAMTWCAQDDANYSKFVPADHAPELALVNPHMSRFSLYTLVRQFKMSASALKSLKDFTSQVRVFHNVPPVFASEGYSTIKFWSEVGDSMLAVSQMSTGEMLSLKLQSDLLATTKTLGRGYFRDIDLGKLGRLKQQMHSYILNLNYAEPQWLMLEAVKNHNNLWSQRGLSPTFWRDTALKVLVGLNLVAHDEEADIKEWLQRQSIDYRAVGWACLFQM